MKLSVIVDALHALERARLIVLHSDAPYDAYTQVAAAGGHLRDALYAEGIEIPVQAPYALDPVERSRQKQEQCG